MILKCAIVISFLFISINISAQTPAFSDTARPAPQQDSINIIDTLVADSLLPGDLTGPERHLLSQQQRLLEYQKSEIPPPRLSYIDSAVTYLASERFNRRSQITQSFFHDAGDYFKFDPAYFVVDYQAMPMRKTVQLFGLTGDRINIVNGGVPFTPFEHIVEPDGLIDMNDVPTELDGNVYIIPGPAGQLLGGDRNFASLVTTTAFADSSKPASTFMADKGYFGYAFVRGNYARKFSNGKEIRISASSRKTEGLEFGRDDEQLRYTGGGHFPLGKNFGLNIDTKMYDRDATLVIRPDAVGSRIYRHRFDRSLLATVDNQNDSRTKRNEIGYRHLRQGSFLDNFYRGRFNNTVNGMLVSQERVFGTNILKAEAAADFSDYDNGYMEYHRINVSAEINLTSLKKINNFSFSAKSVYSDDFNFLPSLTVLYKSEFEKLFVQLSLGYSQREPSQHQLYLPFQQSSIYGLTTKEYSEMGNFGLKKESSLIGSLTIEPGTIENHLSFNITGGKITDAIEWSMQRLSGAVEILHFSPVNEDITFMTISGGPRFRLSAAVRFNAGAAYHYYDYDSLGERPYQPEYNYFTGLELHHYWADRLIDLYAYGELVYTGPYNAYDQQNLGKELIANAKVSIGLKNFRFHLVFQNTLENEYQAREETTIPGRFFYYGLTWHFFD